jgi:hypothetical protein
MTSLAEDQRRVCERFGTSFEPPPAGSKVGVALQTFGAQPLNALRHPPERGTCGWFIWWGETLTHDPEFFQPLHVEHLFDRCPELLSHLALPPGWRVQLAPGHEDAWYDDKLLEM